MSLFEIAAVALMLTGALFTLLAAVGLVRLPDVYCRLSATSKAAPLGIALVLAGAAMVAPGTSDALQAAVIALFVALTAPVAAHVLARAARRGGTPFDATTRHEEEPPPAPDETPGAG